MEGDTLGGGVRRGLPVQDKGPYSFCFAHRIKLFLKLN